MVQITIDTKRDSDEEIRQTIAYLRSLIGDKDSSHEYNQQSSSSSDYENSSVNVESAFSMFGAADASAVSDSFDEEKEEVPKSSSKKKDEEVVFEIVEY